MRTRRGFMGAGAAAAATLSAPAVLGRGRPRVVVIGGGCGGAGVARRLAGDGAVEALLVEPSRSYHTCFFGNLHLGGLFGASGLVHGYEGLARRGVTVVHDAAVAIDRDARTVRLGGGGTLAYDRLVLSPGIDFRWDSVAGYGVADQGAIPHAWKGGAQIALLRDRIAAMPEGGTFVMLPPPAPYRCPPAPYERASMIARFFARHNPKAKVLILDPKESFAKQALFLEGWARRYPGMIEWLPASVTGGVESLDVATLTFQTKRGAVAADAANVVPAQKAGAIAERAGLTDATGFCPIVADTMQSAVDRAIHVLGDAAIAGDMPKSCAAAESQAAAAAAAIRAALTGAEAPPPDFANTCWSVIAEGDAVKIGARYAAEGGRIARRYGFMSRTGEDPARRARTYAEAFAWYARVTAALFG